MRALIRKYADLHGIPESLLHRVIQRESDYNAGARNGPYYGLMQILPQTAQTMGYRGAPSGLLDAETNLLYAGKYLRGAWLVSGGSEERAVMWYAKGYYYEAKRQGLLVETGLRT
jgi:soluble lytic murein transglycosylase-like protein